MSDDTAIRSALPGARHKVIGLVSGGKDSCFNLMHCIANGHEIVALATLTPEPGVDELDSHLYQSVGTHLLPLLAKSMGLPLHTGIIRGTAVSKGPEYGSRLRGGEGSGEKGDETEDLTELLKTVISAHPEATALASGAILSTYQRLRIEHVCSRLNLVSLSYLWQSEQLPLLARMLSSGVEAVIMKVAGVGLGTKVVGKQLGQIIPLLTKLEATYGSHPAGEGGEYETLTLSTPLFSHRLKLMKTETIITDPEPYPVAYLKVQEAELEAKEGWKRPTVSELRELLGLDYVVSGQEGLTEDNVDLLNELRAATDGDVDLSKLKLSAESAKAPIQPSSINAGSSACSVMQGPRFERKGRWFATSIEGVTIEGEDVGQELKACFDALADDLKSRGLSLPLHSTHITLLLSKMSDFLPANAVYKTYFGTSPPSRATVAVPLSRGRVRVEVVGFDDTPSTSGSTPAMGPAHSAAQPQNQRDTNATGSVGGRGGLHVQGLSYWAPANIGPYSQAVMVNARLHLAGQIPLLPASLTLPLYPSGESPYPHQSVLALQHVSKIVDVLRSKNSTGGGWEGWVESAVGWWAEPAPGSGAVLNGEASEVVTKAWELWAERNEAAKAPVIFVQARELPKGALVEYQVNLHTGRQGVEEQIASVAPDPRNKGNDDDDDDDDEDDELEPIYESGQEGGSRWESCITSGANSQGSRAMVFLGSDPVLIFQSLRASSNTLARVLERAVTIRIYHLCDEEGAELESLIDSLQAGGSGSFTYTLIPVFSIHDRYGRKARVGLEVFGV